MTKPFRVSQILPFLFGFIAFVAMSTGLRAEPSHGWPSPEGRAVPLRHGRPRSEVVSCGPNSVYIILRANGVAVSPQLIQELMPTNPNGMSLAEVRDALTNHGLPADVCKCNESDLESDLPCPAIAYTRGTYRSGHYFVVLSANRQVVHVMDATTGQITQTSPAKLLAYGQGYFIIPSLGRDGVMLARIGLLLIIIGIGGYLALHKVRRHRLSTNAMMALLAALTLMVPDLARGAASQTSAQAWRTEGSSGLNLLYVELRTLGFHGSYEQLERQSQEQGGVASLQDLSRLAREMGFSLVVRRLSFAQMSDLSGPMILFTEPEGLRSGSFLLPFDMDRNQVHAVDGATLSFVDLSTDQFRRSWTGYALLSPTRPAYASEFLRYATAPLAAYLLFCVLAATIKRRHLRSITQSARSAEVCAAAVMILMIAQFPGTGLAAESATQSALPPDLTAALEQNATLISPLTVTWHQERVPLVPRMQALKELDVSASAAGGFFWSGQEALAVQGHSLYTHSIRGGAEASFDGRDLYIGTLPEQPLQGEPTPGTVFKIEISRSAKEKPDASWFNTDYLEAAGFSVPRTSRELANGASVTSKLLHLIAEGGRFVESEAAQLSGRRMLRIKIATMDPALVEVRKEDPVARKHMLEQGQNSQAYIQDDLAALKRLQAIPPECTYDFYIDPALHFAVVRRDKLDAHGALTEQVSNSDFEKIDDRALWLPRRSETKYYTWNSIAPKVLTEAPIARRIRVLSWSADPLPKSQFVLNYTMPGTHIIDKTGPTGEVSYDVPASPEELEHALKRAHQYGILGAAPAASHFWLFLVAVGAAIIFITIVSAILARRARARRNSN